MPTRQAGSAMPVNHGRADKLPQARGRHLFAAEDIALSSIAPGSKAGVSNRSHNAAWKRARTPQRSLGLDRLGHFQARSSAMAAAASVP